ncbi:hypothetical protein ACFODZ_07555 [Marinicella sediminis]|uniref:Uncharacterized protein n=1 Tax=Marinicella sediminis TaxID=1792834 RepID=A0ABV7JAJ1_9GAMM|nr:hypothetical protein [Marinicella sediminis]
MKILTLVAIILSYTVEKSWKIKLYLPMEKVIYSAELYYEDCEKYPLKITELIHSIESCWNGPYSSNTEIFDLVSQKNFQLKLLGGELVVISAGADGKFGTKDDFSSSDTALEKKKAIEYYEKASDTKRLTNYFVILIIFIKIHGQAIVREASWRNCSGFLCKTMSLIG